MPSFEADIRPLFRAEDVSAMLFAFDLASYDDVSTNAEAIYERIEDGTMPCDVEWRDEQKALLRSWIDTGMLP